MGLSRTELKALRDYPERFDKDGQDMAPDGSRYGLWTYLNTENCQCETECYCATERVFSIAADDAESFHETVKEMECCPCCGSWYQQGT
jgi:hypothetical protein